MYRLTTADASFFEKCDVSYVRVFVGINLAKIFIFFTSNITLGLFEFGKKIRGPNTKIIFENYFTKARRNCVNWGILK